MQYKLIREMQIDSPKIMPDERTRHWMVAQSHLLMEDGLDEELDLYAQASAGTPFETQFTTRTDVEKARAKNAYNVVREKVERKDLTSDSFFEDLVSEKAYKLDRFAEHEPTAQEHLISSVRDEIESQQDIWETDEKQIVDEISKIMEEYAEPKASASASDSFFQEEKFAGDLQEPDQALPK